MTYIKSIEIQGFKSFASRIKLNFPSGLSVITGPNGSGKSNIVDAICFVLGRSSKKDLRAEKFSHLIFNGGKKKIPSKFTKVTIVLDNSNKEFPYKESEIRISRKVDLKDRGYYRINGVRVTKAEVVNVLKYANIDPEGFNIILQYEIAKFAQMDPIVIRELIEEISGIKMYEEKKEKTLNELSKVDENIKEANIHLAERDRYLKELLVDKEKAESYVKLNEDLKFCNAQLIFKEINTREREIKEINDKIFLRENKIKFLEGKINEIEEKIKSLQLRNEKIEKLIKESGEEEQLKLREAISILKDKQNELRNLIKGYQNEINRIGIRKKQIELEYEQTKKKIDEGKKKIEELEKRIDEITSKINEKEKILESAKIDENFFKLKAQIDEIDKKIFLLREKILEIKKFEEDYKRISEINEEIKKNQEEIELIKGEKNKLYSEIEEISIDLRKKEEEINRIEKELTRLEARKNMLFEMMEHGVKEVLKLKEKINGIYGTVSSLASVKDEFSLPLRIACGNKLNYVVVENEDVAEKCIEHLRKNKIGIATFLPLNRLKKLKKLEIEKVDGFIDLAINLLNYDKKFENVFSYVLGNTIVIKDFETAKRIGIGRYRMVTMDGDLIEKSGAISGGYRQKELIGFNPEKIESEINRLSNLTEKLRNEIKDLRVNLDERQRKLNETKDKEKEILFILNEIQKKKDEIERKIGKIEIKEIKKIEEELNFYEEKRKELFKKINFFPISSEEVLNIQNEIKELKKNFDELKIERSSIEASIKNILLPEIENFEKIKNNLEKEESNFNLEIEKINTQMLKVEEELKEKVENEKKFYEKLKDFFKKRENIAKRNEILQRRKMILTERKNKLNESINALKNERARISGILEGLYKRYEEYRILDIKEVRESFEEINKRIEDIKQKISLIGAPNMRALQIYKEVEKEYNEIKSKVEKLNEERNSIMKIIDEIETKKKVAFLETLTKIEENFQKIHSILCPGWEVKLIIQDPQNLFESGIEVRVKEPGKTFTTIRVLSGGQKTMVALSFIFALQEYRPAPFYIFDEVDEALDKENSDRLAQLIRKYAEKSQFIVISHNDIMIEKSDYLYGVTMKQDGESQIVSMRL